MNLSREGELTLMQVSVFVKAHEARSLSSLHIVYIFDVSTLGGSFFDHGMRAVLECEHVLKIFYDCRGDCDALLHQFDVRVEGVIDCQLLALHHKHKHRSNKNVHNINDDADDDGRHRVRVHRTGGDDEKHSSPPRVEFLMSMSSVISNHIPHLHPEIESLKSTMRSRYIQTPNLWKTRPLGPSLLMYAAFDVVLLHCLYQRLWQDDQLLLDHDRNRVLRYCNKLWVNSYRDSKISVPRGPQCSIAPVWFL